MCFGELLIDLEHGQIASRIGSVNIGERSFAPLQSDVDQHGVAHHVEVGQNQPFVRVDDDAAAERFGNVPRIGQVDFFPKIRVYLFVHFLGPAELARSLVRFKRLDERRRILDRRWWNDLVVDFIAGDQNANDGRLRIGDDLLHLLFEGEDLGGHVAIGGSKGKRCRCEEGERQYQAFGSHRGTFRPASSYNRGRSRQTSGRRPGDLGEFAVSFPRTYSERVSCRRFTVNGLLKKDERHVHTTQVAKPTRLPAAVRPTNSLG